MINRAIQAARDITARNLYPAYRRSKKILAGGDLDQDRHRKEGLRFREGSIVWPPAQKVEWILRRLRFVVRRAATETSHYRDVFASIGFDPFADFSFADFAKLPVLERQAVSEGGTRLISNSVQASKMRRDSTGGSTGEPTQIWLGPEEQGWRQAGSDFALRRLGLNPGSRTAYLWGHHLDATARSSLKDRLYFFLNNSEWFDCFRLESEILAQYHTRMERFRPDGIVAYASALGEMAEWLIQKDIRPSYPTRCILTGAEKLLPRHRQAAQRVFSCPIHERYGSRDLGLIGLQSPGLSPGSYEIDWTNVMVEPELRERESPILVTKLHADAMPMIRYRIGDVGSFPAEARPGHPSLTLAEILGREVDRIFLPDGSSLHGVLVPHLMKDYPVKEYMLVQNTDYSVQVLLAPLRDFREEDRLHILQTIGGNLKGLPLTTVLVGRVPRTKANKLRPVVSYVKNEGEKDRVRK